MKKNSVKGYAILCILFVVISVVTFAVPTEKTAAFWIAYAFAVTALAAQIVIWKAALGREDTMKIKFLGLPVVYIGIVYLIVQLAVFVVFLIVPSLPAWIAVVVCVVIAGVSAICMLVADTGRSEIERVEVKMQKKVFYIKSLQADIEVLANRESDLATKKELTQLAEKIRFSDSMSHEQLAELEAQIAAKVSELKVAADKSEIVTEILFLLDERNQKCKILK